MIIKTCTTFDNREQIHWNCLFTAYPIWNVVEFVSKMVIKQYLQISFIFHTLTYTLHLKKKPVFNSQHTLMKMKTNAHTHTSTTNIWLPHYTNTNQQNTTALCRISSTTDLFCCHIATSPSSTWLGLQRTNQHAYMQRAPFKARIFEHWEAMRRSILASYLVVVVFGASAAADVGTQARIPTVRPHIT